MDSVHEFGPGAALVVCFDAVVGAPCVPPNRKALLFSCVGMGAGHYRVNGNGPLLPAPPRSIAGRLAKIACGN
jgi:hypothetical protein